ncbi:MAG: hypothetical protein QOJ04_3166, partial [Caballeronia sp.]|nr:hypothetical protein [Caballeronia sp.]
MKDTDRKSLEQLFDLSEQFDTRWQGYGSSDAAEREEFTNCLTDFVRLCSHNGIFIPPGSADRRALRSILDRWNSRLREEGVDFGEAGLLAEFDPKAGVVLEGQCPYPGLDPYTASRRGSFFGRDNEIAKAVEHLDAAGNRILMIVGSSGSGKSSLALAGILPCLQDEHASTWLFARPFTPGAAPIMALAAAVAQVIGEPDSAPEIQRSLTEAPEQAHAKLAAVCEGRPLMLLIDQFEELLTLCQDLDEQGRFARILCSLSDPSPAPPNGSATRILLTLRTDHQDRFERRDALLPLHRRLVGEHNYNQLSTLGFAEIRRGIKEPADNVGLRFVPPELIDRLASQTAGLANGLPLLQFVLQRLWETRPWNAAGQRLDLISREMVEGLPDVQGALGRVAEGVFRNFTGLQQRACERLLLELVVLDENFEEPLRRRRDETELISAMQLSGYAAADIGRVISDFVGHYLVRRFGDTPDSQLEVAHEALLRNWPHITDILTGSNVKERLHLVQEIRREAVEWLDRGRRDDELRVHGDRLVRAVTSATQGWLVGRTAAEYIAACQRREAENRGRDKRLRVLRWWVTVAWVIVLPLIGGSILSFLYVRTIQERNDQLKVIENAFDAMTGLSDLLLLDAVNDIARRDTLPPAVLTKLLKSASSAYDPIILRSQGNAVAYNGRGSARLADPENPEIGAAIEDFTRAIELQQDNASYH